MTQVAVIKKTKSSKKYYALYFMMIPGVIYFIINSYLPMLGIIIAFKNINFTKGLLNSEWIGFKNFEYLFKTTDAFIITRNTILYNSVFIIINLVAAVAVAILLNEVKNRLMARFYQSVILLPYLISMVIVGYLVFSVLSSETGWINKTILPLFGMDWISWYSEPKYWPVILGLVNLWKNSGYLCVIYYAAIIGIDHEYYEAAEIDGASKWQQIVNITLPLIKQVMVVMTLLQVGRIFYSDFGLFYQVPLNAGALLSATNVIDTYVYRALMTTADIGMASAAGLYQSVVGFIMVVVSNYVVRKVDKENALF
ncbi:MAG: sugar ABC transporter permease [Clostridiales bacterium GWC2_40_7]|nr:MAG: sugar ABC transporter permease [Clostridiales bacterium GWC2_40_7]